VDGRGEWVFGKLGFVARRRAGWRVLFSVRRTGQVGCGAPARYAVARDRWNDVELAVYHHPPHDTNVRTMLEAMKVSLEVFSKDFSPFQFKQLRILEFPAYAVERRPSL
ncbi:MAG: hypothetical protein ACKOZX_11305, partial [Gammaproteobacteria bacterium]